MSPLDISNHAISEYVQNVHKRENEPIGKKRLVCIGQGQNVHLECWDDNWTLPFMRFGALFRGGSSLDFAKITEYYCENAEKNADFEKTIRKYYSGEAPHTDSFNRLSAPIKEKVMLIGQRGLSVPQTPAPPQNVSTRTRAKTGAVRQASTQSRISSKQLKALVKLKAPVPPPSTALAAPKVLPSPDTIPLIKDKAALPKVNYLLPNVLMGAYPGDIVQFKAENMHAQLAEEGITHFICLMTDKELKGQDEKMIEFVPYDTVAQQAAEAKAQEVFIDRELQIPDVGIIHIDEVKPALAKLVKLADSPQNKLYIHCHGGNGRTSLIATALLSQLYNVPVEVALKHMFANYLTRGAPLRPYLPESKEQFEQLKALCVGTSSLTYEAWQEESKKMCRELRPDLEIRGYALKKKPPEASPAAQVETPKPTNVDATKLMQVALDAQDLENFSSINSSSIKPIALAGSTPIEGNPYPREVFLENNTGENQAPPPVLIRSEFIPDALTAHLVTDKAPLAIQLKSNEIVWEEGKPPITNVEAIYAQLQVQLVKAQAAGDISFHKNYSRFDGNNGREIVVSTNIHPDYERPDDAGKVMARLTQITEKPRIGKPLPADFALGSAEADVQLLDNLVYQLTADAMLPSLDEIEGDIFTINDAKSYIEQLIENKKLSQTDIANAMKNKFVKIQFPDKEEVHSLEVLFNHYVHQLRNEFSGLEALLPKGYVYTIDPPAIFATAFDKRLMTRLQILGMKFLFEKAPPAHLKMIGFNDDPKPPKFPYGDGDVGATKLLQHVFGEEKAVSKMPGIYKPHPVTKKPAYAITEKWALVLHNNSDAFGNNIRNEKGFESLDAVVGAITTAAASLEHPEQLQHCYPPLKEEKA